MVTKSGKEKKKTETVDEPKDNVDAVDTVEAVEEPAAEAAPPVKRQLGVKEPIVFKWKILGDAEGYVLTLFKAVEREEADAQLERLLREGYYKNVRIVDSAEKIVQTKPVHSPEPPPKPVARSGKAAEAKTKATAKKPKPAPKPSAKTKTKPVAKSAKKKAPAPSAKRKKK